MTDAKAASRGWSKWGVALIATIVVLAFGAESANADPDCANGNACYFSENGYLGLRANITDQATTGQWFAGNFPEKSAKNRFGNRKIQFANDTSPGGFHKCLDPGEEDDTMPGYQAWKLGAPGSRC